MRKIPLCSLDAAVPTAGEQPAFKWKGGFGRGIYLTSRETQVPVVFTAFYHLEAVACIICCEHIVTYMIRIT